MIFTLDDIKTQIPEPQFAPGRRLFERGDISAANVQRGGELITAIISLPTRPIRVYIRIEINPSGVQIKGECSCSPDPNCQHVVAVMLQALKDNDTLTDDRIDENLNDIPQCTKPEALSPAVKSRQGSVPNEQMLLYFIDLQHEDCLIETVTARYSPTSKNSTKSSTENDGLFSLDRIIIGKYYDPENVNRSSTARFISRKDKQLLTILSKLPRQAVAAIPELSGPNSSQLLLAMINTGRCFLKDGGERPLSWGNSIHAGHRWEIDYFGTQTLQLQSESNIEVIHTLPEVTYLQEKTSQCGPLTFDLSTDIIASLQKFSPVAADDIAQTKKGLEQRLPNIDLPELRHFQIEEKANITPTVCLNLFTEKHQPLGVTQHTSYAELYFDYAGVIFRLQDPALHFDGKQILRMERDKKLEDDALDTLMQIGFEPSYDADSNGQRDAYYLSHRQQDWLDFQLENLPKLHQQGWRIEIDASFIHRVVIAKHWFCETKARDKQDWFDITIGIDINGVKTNILPALLQFIRQYSRGIPKQMQATEQFALALDDGRILAIPAARMQRILNSLLELYDNKVFSKQDTLSLHRLQLARLAEWDSDNEDSRLNWICDTETQSLVDNLCQENVISEVSPPQGLTAELRDYQKRGLDWLQFLSRYQLAGILADDMGLGKTVQTLAHLLVEKEQGRAKLPSLVIAPTTLMFNWFQEAKKFAPSLKVLTLWGPNRHDLYKDIAGHDLILTTYPLIVRDKDKLLALKFHLLILDEAQVIKNSNTKASREIRKIDAQQRLCLSGTPLENHLGELWSLFDFLLPGLLGTHKQFQRFFRTPIEKNGDTKTADRLRLRLRPFLLRRTKQQVAKDLPQKTEIIQSVVLDTAQRELYETVRLAMYQVVRQEIEQQGLSRSHIIVLDALLKLRQVCCDPRLVKTVAAQKVKQSAKLETLMQLVPELVDEGRRILIFSQFTTMLGLIEKALNQADITYVTLTGQTRDRQQVVEKFQSKQVPVFLISLKAGGLGLNLTTADTVIHYDPWWNPAIENQATDRAHRIGQKNPVFVYKFICLDTVEEKIRTMQQQKQALADNLYQGNSGKLPQWTPQDLEHLFSPIEPAPERDYETA